MGFFTRQNRFHRYLEERRGQTFDDDESYAPRIVVPDHECEVSGEPQLLSFARPPSCDASIRDETAMYNGKISSFTNGYNMIVDRANATELTVHQTDNSRSCSPHGVMEYTDSDIITTTSSEKLPNNLAEPRETSPTISACSKETEV